MTLQVPSLLSPLVDKFGKIVSPWNSFFQTFTQAPGEAIDVPVTASVFNYTAGQLGSFIIVGGTLTGVVLTRGGVGFNVDNNRQLLLAKDDIISIAYSVAPTSFKFLPMF